jgi:methylglutaconyl-CoA hydratase
VCLGCDMTESVLFEKSIEGVATLTLNRPDVHNAFDEHMIALLASYFDELAEDDSIKCVVLRSEGKSFSAGADLNWMKRAAGYTQEQNTDDALALSAMLQKLYDMPQLNIALVDGAAIGGGLGLVSCCDVVLATERSKFCLSEVKLGLIPATIGPYVMRAIGARQMRRYAQTAEMIHADRALDIGLVHEVFEDERAMTSYLDALLVHQIAKNAQQAMRASKILCADLDGAELSNELREDTAKRIANIRAGGEAKEGLSAFLDKRSPKWIRKD